MCGVDKVLTKEEIKVFEKEQKIKKRLGKEEKNRLAREETFNLTSSCIYIQDIYTASSDLLLLNLLGIESWTSLQKLINNFNDQYKLILN